MNAKLWQSDVGNSASQSPCAKREASPDRARVKDHPRNWHVQSVPPRTYRSRPIIEEITPRFFAVSYHRNHPLRYYELSSLNCERYLFSGTARPWVVTNLCERIDWSCRIVAQWGLRSNGSAKLPRIVAKIRPWWRVEHSLRMPGSIIAAWPQRTGQRVQDEALDSRVMRWLFETMDRAMGKRIRSIGLLESRIPCSASFDCSNDPVANIGLVRTFLLIERRAFLSDTTTVEINSTIS